MPIMDMQSTKRFDIQSATGICFYLQARLPHQGERDRRNVCILDLCIFKKTFTLGRPKFGSSSILVRHVYCAGENKPQKRVSEQKAVEMIDFDSSATVVELEYDA